MENFLTLYKKFIAGLKRIDGIVLSPNPWINPATEWQRFDADVIEPMDLAWNNLTNEERKQFLKGENNV